ncbi:MAG: zinc carboxypeptidase [Flavobacteriaceae bacterium]|nr:zinc carboxypeptidase [Flavobacteriaceae bacterium]
MKVYKKVFMIIFIISFSSQLNSQNYYFEEYQPFNKEIPSPEEFLGYPIGDYHTRHDLVVAYLEKLAELSDKATLLVYGKTNENRKLTMLTITSLENHKNFDAIKEKHLQVVDKNTNITNFSDLPVFINMGYGVHGNEPSSTEAAMLMAYTLVASESEKVKEYLKETIIFLDPTINPDGRDRHTNWANTYRGSPLIADKNDIEHNEGWPRGRTNHYWFDLNRDLLLAVQPESIARLKWYHEWYPNVVTDFHEMGTSSTYFFEPKNMSASLNPITPIENYTTLNNLFAEQFSADLDKIGSLYFTGEQYDATYPGYGSTYMDLQGSLALLFEQASSRGHLQETPTGEISLPFTIKNQYVSSFATIKAAIKHKDLLYKYQNEFFKKSLDKASKSKIKAYVFGDDYDKNRTKEFLDVLLKHKIKVYGLDKNMNINNKTFNVGNSYVVPTKQNQHYMVQTIFETYEKYRDSVYYDASAWSLVNFYNMKYNSLAKIPNYSNEITIENNILLLENVQKSNYAYVIPWDDYYAPAALYALQEKGLIIKTSTKPFSILANGKESNFNRGSLVITSSIQSITKDSLFSIVNSVSKKYNLQAYGVNSGFTSKGNGLGSRSIITLKKPNAMMVVEGGVSSYEAGEVWHLFEQRMNMPISKVPERNFYRTDLNKYNVIILVSGNYKMLDKKSKEKLKTWVSQGNTLITSARSNSWIIKNKIVDENLVKAKKDSSKQDDRLNYADARGTIGKQSIGGAIFKVDLDITHPIGFGYHNKQLPVYKNNSVFISPSKSRFSTVAKYSSHPHIDGYITEENLEKMGKAASIVVSKIGSGRVVMFADNPNFRGAWYGTNKLFMNAVFFGSIIKTPK